MLVVEFVPRRDAQAERERVKLGLPKPMKGRGPAFDSRKAWTPEELRAFHAVAQHDRWGIMLLFLVYTGMRRSEACGLHWDEVDLHEGTVDIVEGLVKVSGGKTTFETPKSEASARALPLSQEALECLRERRRQQALDRARRGDAWVDSGLVFTYSKGTKVHPDNLKREMARLCEKAGVRRIAIHTLRDTFATLLAQQKDVSLEVISGYLGHVDPAVTLHRYRQVQQEEMRKIALRKLRQGTASLTGTPEDEGRATD